MYTRGLEWLFEVESSILRVRVGERLSAALSLFKRRRDPLLGVSVHVIEFIALSGCVLPPLLGRVRRLSQSELKVLFGEFLVSRTVLQFCGILCVVEN